MCSGRSVMSPSLSRRAVGSTRPPGGFLVQTDLLHFQSGLLCAKSAVAGLNLAGRPSGTAAHGLQDSCHRSACNL
jgi:hypothetical protein